MAEDKVDLLTQYHNISHKLQKKRILKKPNVAEASQQFEVLALNFQRENLEQYSGLCCQAAAKCQGTLGNVLEEGLLSLKASKQFMSGYLENIKDSCVSNKSFLSHGYVLYKDCLERLKDCNELSDLVRDAFMGSITLEMGDNLNEKAYLTAEGYHEYVKAIQLFSKSPLEKINCLKKVISLKIKVGDYKECLKLVNDLIEETKNLPENAFKENILKESEITRIFLLLILRPTIQQISPQDASALEKYAWVETSSSNDVKELSISLKNQGLSMLEEDLYLNLQSLVMSCQYCDTEGLELLERDLMEYLSNEQISLFRTLVEQYKT